MMIKEIVIIGKETDYEDYMRRYPAHDDCRLMHTLEGMGLDAQGLYDEYSANKDAISKVLDWAEHKDIRYSYIRKSQLKSRLLDTADLIIAVGGDATLMHAADYMAGDALFFGINSYPKRSKGYRLYSRAEDFEEKLERVLKDEFTIRKIPRTEAMIYNDTVHIAYALNEVHVNKEEDGMCRYFISANGITEWQQSSGVVVALKEGASGWLNNIRGSSGYDGHEDDLQFINRDPKLQGREYVLNQGYSRELIIKADDSRMRVTIDANDAFRFNIQRGHYVVIRPAERYVLLAEF